MRPICNLKRKNIAVSIPLGFVEINKLYGLNMLSLRKATNWTHILEQFYLYSEKSKMYMPLPPPQKNPTNSQTFRKENQFSRIQGKQIGSNSKLSLLRLNLKILKKKMKLVEISPNHFCPSSR